jgi:hypothetical protein
MSVYVCQCECVCVCQCACVFMCVYACARMCVCVSVCFLYAQFTSKEWAWICPLTFEQVIVLHYRGSSFNTIMNLPSYKPNETPPFVHSCTANSQQFQFQFQRLFQCTNKACYYYLCIIILYDYFYSAYVRIFFFVWALSALHSHSHFTLLAISLIS